MIKKAFSGEKIEWTEENNMTWVWIILLVLFLIWVVATV